MLFINDLPDIIEGHSKLYADDNKVISFVNTDSGHVQLQANIDRLQEWSNKWQLYFNIDKCKIMHIGKKNPNHLYTMMDKNHQIKTLGSTTQERDIGVILSNDLKVNVHIQAITSRSNSILGQLLNSFKYLDKSTYRTLYCSFVRPHLEFAASAWNPYFKKDIELLEKVQQRATKRAPGLGRLPQAERLKILKLTTLEERRMRGDLIQQYKIINKIDQVNWNHQPKKLEFKSTRGHSQKLEKERFHAKFSGEARFNFFTNRIVNSWNALSSETVEAKSVNSFKARIDKMYDGKGSYTA